MRMNWMNKIGFAVMTVLLLGFSAVHAMPVPIDQLSVTLTQTHELPVAPTSVLTIEEHGVGHALDSGQHTAITATLSSAGAERLPADHVVPDVGMWSGALMSPGDGSADRPVMASLVSARSPVLKRFTVQSSASAG